MTHYFGIDSLQSLRYVAAASVPKSKLEMYNSWRSPDKPEALPYSSMQSLASTLDAPHKPIKSTHWIPKSGCHFSCMENARGLQLVEASRDSASKNIQLCSPDLMVS